MSFRANLSGLQRWPRSCRIVRRESMAATWVRLAAATPCRNSNARSFAWVRPVFFLRSVKTRYGLHIAAADTRILGNILPFEEARERVCKRLKQSVEARALLQYISFLAGRAEIVGIDLQRATSPLVQ